MMPILFSFCFQQTSPIPFVIATKLIFSISTHMPNTWHLSGYLETSALFILFLLYSNQNLVLRQKQTHARQFLHYACKAQPSKTRKKNISLAHKTRIKSVLEYILVGPFLAPVARKAHLYQTIIGYFFVSVLRFFLF